jgi:hypothetical protein
MDQDGLTRWYQPGQPPAGWTAADVRERWPAVGTLFGAHLNLDWRDEYDSFEDFARQVLDTADPVRRHRLLVQLESFSRAVPDDDTLEGILEVTGSGLMPEHDTGLTPLAWLAALTERVRRPR